MGKSRFLIAILLLCTSSAGADEIGIPAIESGLEITPIASSTSFALTLEYSLQRHKAQLEPGEYRVTLPIPSSDESQRVTISKVTGFEIGRIARDYHGNSVIVGIPTRLGDLPAYVSVDMIINKQPIKMSIPPNYYYEMAMDGDLFAGILTNESLTSHLPDFSFEMESNIDFNGLHGIVTTYKTDIDEVGDGFERIYDGDIQEFYPVDRFFYLRRAIDLIAVLRENGIAARIAKGWSVPPGLDTYREDFVVQVFLPGHGMMVFDRKLDLFADEYHFISYFYSLAESTSFSSCGYVGMAKNEDVYVIGEPIFMSCGQIIGNQPDARYTALSYKMDGYHLGRKNLQDFISQHANVNQESFRTVRKIEQEKRYFDQPVQYRVDDIVFSKRLDSQYDPIDISDRFSPGDKIYATVMFRGSGYEKHVLVRWRSPSGDIFHTSEDDVKKTWRSFFNSIRLSGAMEKGQWTVEVVLNGVLEIRKHFELSASP